MNDKPTLAFYGMKHDSFMHDHNICVMQNGRVLRYLQLERYTGKKYDNRLDLYIEELIDDGLLELPEEFDIVSVNSFAGNAFISGGGRIRVESPVAHRLSDDLEPALAWLQISGSVLNKVDAYNCPHELAHVASCMPFFGEFMENSLLISFDGGSSRGNFSAFHFINGKPDLLEYGWDELGYLSKFFNDNPLNFNILGEGRDKHCGVPGKLMGYASYGTYNKEIETWLKGNGFFTANDDYYWKNPGAILLSIRDTFGVSMDGFESRDPFLQNVAATFQHIFERELTRKVIQLQERTGAEYLYYSGGCALNIVTNTKIIDTGVFRDVFIPPCCNDSGLSIGAASLLERKKGNEIQIHSPYLCNVGLNESAAIAISGEVIALTAEIILAGGIVGVCNGNAEVGPRALGNRSLIARADSVEIAKRLSMEVKKREWYRPVAPIMLESVAAKVTARPVHHLAKFMLLDFCVSKEYERHLRGVIHADNTARIQIIGGEGDNPFMFSLLTFLYERHGMLALINTSFNSFGEPIAHTTEDAVRSVKEMGLHGLVINNALYKKGDGL